MKTICFIGAGKMASAIAGGLVKSKSPFAIGAYDTLPAAADTFASQFGAKISSSAAKAVKDADIVLLAVKPQYLKEAVSSLKGKLGKKLILSIVAGIPLSTLAELTGTDRIIRIMPNTPALAGEGMSCLTAGPGASKEDMDLALTIFRSVGKAIEIPEKNMDAVTGLSGSAPAYVLEFINALADGGVYMGLPRVQALELAVQTVLGTAKLVQETGMHPMVLRDNVISPAGTTARGVMVLAERGFAAAAANAVIRAAETSAVMGAKKA